MKLFIFGAGASRGSSYKSPQPNSGQAPLANELLDVVYKDYAKAIGIDLENLRDRFLQRREQTLSLEEWLTNLWAVANHGGGGFTAQAATSLRGDLGRFAHYLRWMFQSISQDPSNGKTYYQLLSKLRKESENGVEHTFINFNYDTLFDIAYTQVWSSTLEQVDAYLSQRILKPHGSINWFTQKRDGDAGIPDKSADPDFFNRYRLASANLFKSDGLKLTNHKSFEPNHQLLQQPSFISTQFFNWDYFQPMIFLPLSEKMFEHIPELSAKIEQRASELLTDVNEIFLVGYKAKDKLIHEWVERFINGKAVLNIVSNTKVAGDEIMSRLVSQHPNKIASGQVIYNPSGANGFQFFVGNYGKA